MTGNLELCRDRIELKGKAVLGIHSNVAGDHNGYTSGHAWVSIDTPTRVIYLGLWPDGHPRVLEKRANCTDVRVDMEAGALPLVSRYYELSDSQLMRLNAFINRPDVWGYMNTCAAWATQLVKEVLGVPLSAIDYALFSTPRELGRELQKLERMSPTSPSRPRMGELREVGLGK